MSKFYNHDEGNGLPKGVPLYALSSSFLNSLPYYRDWCAKMAEKERRDIMAEKIFTAEDFERMGKFIEEKIRESREKNEIKNSILFNTDYAKVEEAISRLFQNPETCKKFRENMQDIFTNRRNDKPEKKDGPRLIFEYIRKKKRGIVGLLVGYRADNKDFFCTGYSLCNPKDKFDLFTAFQLAFHSMFRIQKTYKNVPQSIKRQKKSFGDRCSAYFKAGRGAFLLSTHKDKLWVDFCSLIPEEVKEKMDVDHFSFKSFVLTPKKKEEDKVNVMYANRVDIEHVNENEFHNRLFQGERLLYKNIRFGGCTKERPKSRCVKITWEFLD